MVFGKSPLKVKEEVKTKKTFVKVRLILKVAIFIVKTNRKAFST